MKKTKEKVEEIKDKLNKLGYQRKVWIPITQDKKGKLTDSKFCGTAFLLENETFPLCKECKEPMQLLLQVNLETLPIEYLSNFPENFGEGYIQLFYCTNEETDCGSKCLLNAMGEEEGYHLIRFIQKGRVNEKNISTISKSNLQFSEKVIIGWKEEGFEYPSTLENINFKSLGIEMNDEIEFSKYYSLIDSEKIGGWPVWINDKEWETCTKCKNDLEILIQISSNNTIPYIFGDYGIGHIFICTKHKEELLFLWNCY